MGKVTLPHGASIVAVVRGEDSTLIVARDAIIEPNDRVLVFIKDTKRITSIETLFQVSPTLI